MGRPSTYKPIYCDQIIKYFSPPYYLEKDMTITKSDGTTIDKTELEPLPPRFLTDFATSIGLPLPSCLDTLKNWSKKNPEFLGALKIVKTLQVQMIRTNASMGLYPPAFSIFTLKNIEDGDGIRWRDTQEIKHEGEAFKIQNIYQIVEAIQRGDSDQGKLYSGSIAPALLALRDGLDKG